MPQQDQIRTLLRQLSQFGLNPNDWTPSELRGRRLRLRHNRDREFFIQGNLCWTKKRNPRWGSLEVISI